MPSRQARATVPGGGVAIIMDYSPPSPPPSPPPSHIAPPSPPSPAPSPPSAPHRHRPRHQFHPLPLLLRDRSSGDASGSTGVSTYSSIRTTPGFCPLPPGSHFSEADRAIRRRTASGVAPAFARRFQSRVVVAWILMSIVHCVSLGNVARSSGEARHATSPFGPSSGSSTGIVETIRNRLLFSGH